MNESRDRQSAVRLVVFCCLTLTMLGCSPPGPLPQGIVRFEDGQPVKSGSIEFRSLNDGQRYAGRIATDGTFALQNKDEQPECPPGEYEIVVVQIVLTEDLAIDKHSHGRTVPRKYADYSTSDLRYNNLADRTDPIAIELQSQP